MFARLSDALNRSKDVSDNSYFDLDIQLSYYRNLSISSLTQFTNHVFDAFIFGLVCDSTCLQNRSVIVQDTELDSMEENLIYMQLFCRKCGN